MAFDSTASGPVNFLDVAFSGLDLATALDAVTVRATLGGRFSYVATPNVDHVVGLSKEPARRTLYDNAWLTLNDSRILSRLATRAGLKLPTATGADLAKRLFDQVIEPSEPVTIIGGDAKTIAKLTKRYKLTDVRWYDAPMGLKQNPAAIVEAAAFAAAQEARFTFICVGAPQQELIAFAIKQRGDARGVGLCVGAALEFIAKRKHRAPRLMRALGLEWLHRLLSEPSRMWRRYLVDGPRVFSLFAEWRSAMIAASAA